MKRQISTILCATVAGFACLTGGIALSQANAATSTDALITPNSYQEYLTLNAPYDLAVSENFTAIADGSNIYVYSKDNTLYQTYVHEENASDPNNNVITKLAFAENNTLYFLDGTSSLYSFHPGVLFNGTADTASKSEWLTKATDFSCSNFAISGNDLYFLNGNSGTYNIYQTALSSPTTDAPTKVNASSDSVLYMQGDNLYYTSSNILRMSGATSKTWTDLTDVTDKIYSMAILGNVVYYTSAGSNAFYAYDLVSNQSVITPFQKENGQRGYSAVTTHAGKVYVIKNQSVCEYDPALKAFTDFEIGASSTSKNRLQAGKDSVLFKDKLYTTDVDRVSIYDTKTQTYTTLKGTMTADHIATDGETVLLATTTKAVLYSIATGEALLTLENPQHFNGSIVGVTQVYGKYYFATNAMQYCQISKGDTWTCRSSNRLNNQPQLIASDAQGYLYLMTTGGNVYRLTEADFMSSSELTSPVFSVASPSTTKKLLLDYKQNLYALQGNNLIKYTTVGESSTDLGKQLVYKQTTSTPVTTVAFGAERGEAYLLYDGNLIVSTLDLDLPSMSTIATEDAYLDLTEGTAEFSVVKTKVGTLLVEFDLDMLENSDAFPYLGHMRTSLLPDEQLTALKLGETTDYAILAIFDGKNYHTYLARKGANAYEDLSDDEYRVNYTPADYKTGWLSTSANLYKFPYLTELLTITQLPKNQQLTIVGEITELDYDYYCVQYDDNGTIKEGYVPKSFINFFDGTPPQSTESVFGEGQADVEAGWRLAYILLGCAAIIILVDFLILRPRKKDD